jgi:hypothetical protein
LKRNSTTDYNLQQTENEIKKIQKDLKSAEEENEYLQKTIIDRGRHDGIIKRLDTEKDSLQALLKQEVFSKNELHRKYESVSMELVEVKKRANDEIQRFKRSIQSEKDNSNKISAQMRSTNQVLEAEVQVQRSYVNELRAKSWTDLAVRIRTEIEAAVTQELTKSSMGVSEAVGSCEERWKRQIQEIQLQHQHEIVKMKEQSENDLRFKLSQNQICLEEAKVSIEGKLKKEYNQSLDAAMRQEEMHRLFEVQNESKKWEQVRCKAQRYD